MGFVHAGLVTLLRRVPHLIVEVLIARGLLPAGTYRIRSCPTEVFVPLPGGRVSERRADVVLEICPEFESNERWGIIVEVQLGEDDEKHASWSVFYAAYRLELGEHIFLVAVTLDAIVAQWVRDDVAAQIQNMRVCVLEPDRFPIWLNFSPEDEPERALLMAMVAVAPNDQRARLPAAIQALGRIRGLDHVIYVEMLLSHFDEEMLMNAAQQVPIVDAEFEARLRNYQPTDRERGSMIYTRALEEGRQEGHQEGALAQQARALLAVLDHRGLHPNLALRERVSTCRDLAQLEAWFVRALTIEHAEALFD